MESILIEPRCLSDVGDSDRRWSLEMRRRKGLKGGEFQPKEGDAWPRCSGSSWLPWWLSGKRISLKCRRHRRCRFDPWVGRSPGGRNGYPFKYLAWRISWTEEPGGLHRVHGVTQSQTGPGRHTLGSTLWSSLETIPVIPFYKCCSLTLQETPSYGEGR